MRFKKCGDYELLLNADIADEYPEIARYTSPIPCNVLSYNRHDKTCLITVGKRQAIVPVQSIGQLLGVTRPMGHGQALILTIIQKGSHFGGDIYRNYRNQRGGYAYHASFHQTCLQMLEPHSPPHTQSHTMLMCLAKGKGWLKREQRLRKGRYQWYWALTKKGLFALRDYQS